MNKKGFTLVELLAVLGLLSIIALMATPILLNQIDSQKKKNYENFVGDLCLSAEAYLNHTTNIDGIENFKSPGDTIDIKLGDLMKNGYVKSSTKNPKTKRKIKAKDTITVTITSNKTYSCELDTESDTPIFAPQSFATDSWATIAANPTSDKYKVGDEKIIQMDAVPNGNDETYHIIIVNKSTPSECSNANFSQSGCGMVLQFKEAIDEFDYDKRRMNFTDTNVGGWPASFAYTYLNTTIYNKMPSDLKNVIINTKVISGHGSTEGETNFTSTDKLYLLSRQELFGDNSSYDKASSLTRRLDYYIDNTPSAKQGGKIWWLRNAVGTISFSVVSTIFDSDNATQPNYFVPAFRIGEQ